jgi:hypothetical protein
MTCKTRATRAARSRRCVCVNCPDIIACSTTASAVFIPATCGGEGKQIVSGANDVQGGVLFVCTTQPHPALRATPERALLVSTHKRRGDKKEQPSPRLRLQTGERRKSELRSPLQRGHKKRRSLARDQEAWRSEIAQMWLSWLQRFYQHWRIWIANLPAGQLLTFADNEAISAPARHVRAFGV